MAKNKSADTKSFQKLIWDFYKENKRDFPWRQTFDPYKILISEVMLQQTQTYRVVPKYEAWIKEFPDFKTLSHTPFAKVLQFWSGLGYNRRALYLHTTAKRIEDEFKGILPLDPEILQTLPGIGKNTAGSVYVFSSNKPYVFIETNIRRVFIHHFFSVPCHPGLDPGSPLADSGSEAGMTALVHDNELLPLIEQTLDIKNPREWYFALMDYGNMLAKHPPAGGNANKKSKHYTKQSKFEGSLRQVRGKILKLLLKQKSITVNNLQAHINDSQLEKALQQLENEKFIKITNKKVTLT